jgi:hypothetical protein
VSAGALWGLAVVALLAAGLAGGGLGWAACDAWRGRAAYGDALDDLDAAAWEREGLTAPRYAAELEPLPGELPGLHDFHDHAPLAYGDEGVPGRPVCERYWECAPAPPSPGAGAAEWRGTLAAPAERCATPAEMRAEADRAVWAAEVGALIDGAWDWYDREFGTGEFRAVS